MAAVPVTGGAGVRPAVSLTIPLLSSSGIIFFMAIKKESANTTVSDKPKRKPPKSAWKPGQSGNPKGRPADGESWAGIIAEMAAMTADAVAQEVGKSNELGRSYLQLPKNVKMKRLIVARLMAAIMFEPSSGLVNILMERTDGKVRDNLDLTTGGEKLPGSITVRMVKDDSD